MTQWATWLPPVETRVGATDTDEVEFGVIRIDRSHLNRFDIICNLQWIAGELLHEEKMADH